RDDDPRVRDLGREILDDYATIRESYQAPKHPIILAHGLLGFSELPSPIPYLPPVQYWHGITSALAANSIKTYTPSVPPSASIPERAAALSASITAQLADSPSTTAVNIIAHSMGGLDARYMIAHCPPEGIKIASLTTIATPHRGSAFADYVLEPGAGPLYLPRLYGLLERAGLSTTAFSQLTTTYMKDEFNPSTPDVPGVKYYSFGAAVEQAPPALSPFRYSWSVVGEKEGENDGLVSVRSSRWGEYRGTLMGVSHLDLINWSNRMRWMVREWMGMKKTFNAVALYLDIADMLAKEGL
ncbi:alpha/beta-hydrolase, partial [Sarocladium strictum]